jgi:hypothetical protein
MSGMKYLPLTGKDLFPETWDVLKNGSRKAALAGHGQVVARQVHELAIEISSKRGITYDEAENIILEHVHGPANNVKLNAALDKFSQPMQPGPNMADNHRTTGIIMKARQVTKSSKGKHPKNYIPPKKKRK